MVIILGDGRVVDILMIDFTWGYVDWEFQEVPGHCRTNFVFISYMTLEADIKAAIESDLVVE